MSAKGETASAGLLAKAKTRTGEDYAECYQCGKCTAGCPLGELMDYPINRIVRFVQLGGRFEEKALKSRAIWTCLSCHTCSARCPQELEPAHLMDFLRRESRRRNMVHPDAKRILRFHKIFMNSVRRFGRVSEIELIGLYKAADALGFDFRNALKDAGTGPFMFFSGKLPLIPHRIKARGEIEKIFKHCLDEAEE